MKIWVSYPFQKKNNFRVSDLCFNYTRIFIGTRLSKILVNHIPTTKGHLCLYLYLPIYIYMYLCYRIRSKKVVNKLENFNKLQFHHGRSILEELSSSSTWADCLKKQYINLLKNNVLINSINCQSYFMLNGSCVSNFSFDTFKMKLGPCVTTLVPTGDENVSFGGWFI